MVPSIKFTPNLILRIENEDCADKVLALYEKNKDAFERFEPTRPQGFYTLDYHRRSLRREYFAYLAGSFIRYYVYEASNPDTIIGSVNYNIINTGGERFAELGYKIDTSHQRKGYAYEACMSTFDMLHERYHINRIDARIHPDNIASIRLAEKIGFTPTSYESKSANILGHYVDLVRYSVTISDIQ